MHFVAKVCIVLNVQYGCSCVYNGGECLSVDIAVIFAGMSAVVCECIYDKL